MTDEEPVAGRGSPVAGEEDAAQEPIEGVALEEGPQEEVEVSEPGDRRPETGDREIEIAESDAAVERELRRMSRRGFLTLGGGALAGYAAWKWLRLRPKIGGVEWPLRRGFELDERVAEAYFRPSRMMRTFPPSAITNARINGGLGLSQNYDVSTWRLQVLGGAKPLTLTMDDFRRLPKRTMITQLNCIEGWTIVVKWAGVRLADLTNEVLAPKVRYVGMETPDRGYYVGLDMESAMHPQTLLAYEMNDRPLTWQHGSPLRLAIPVKYGVKNIKRVSLIRYTDVRPADYWAEQGYDWYLGH